MEQAVPRSAAIIRHMRSGMAETIPLRVRIRPRSTQAELTAIIRDMRRGLVESIPLRSGAWEEVIRISDLGGALPVVEPRTLTPEYEKARNYFAKLEKSFSIAVLVSVIALTGGIFSFATLAVYLRNGIELIHPGISLVLGLSSGFLLLVAFTACYSMKQNFKVVVTELWAVH